MTIYIVFTDYLPDNVFGVYSTIKRARIALEKFLTDNNDIISMKDMGNYGYRFTAKDGKTYDAEICFDTLDDEFVTGICKEDK